MTRVTAMAGMVRRIRELAAARAKRMQATGTRPWVSYQVLLYLPLNAPVSGSRVQVASEPSASAATATTPKTSATFVVIQRSGLTDWVQASRWVPASYSRETSGAAQNMQASKGRAIRAPVNGGIVWK